jgi:hypothetical protein
MESYASVSQPVEGKADHSGKNVSGLFETIHSDRNTLDVKSRMSQNRPDNATPAKRLPRKHWHSKTTQSCRTPSTPSVEDPDPISRKIEATVRFEMWTKYSTRLRQLDDAFNANHFALIDALDQSSGKYLGAVGRSAPSGEYQTLLAREQSRKLVLERDSADQERRLGQLQQEVSSAKHFLAQDLRHQSDLQRQLQSLEPSSASSAPNTFPILQIETGKI